MSKLFLLLSFLLASVFVYAQKEIIFTNVAKNKVFRVHEGQALSLRYKGYLGQTEFAKNIITEITDSTVSLGADPALFGGGMLRNNEMLLRSYKVIRISDIQAFRRMSAGRMVLKSLTTVGLVVGSYFILYDVYRDSDVNVGEGFLISLGVGLGAKLLVDGIFPENAKYKIEDGWKMNVVQPK